MGRIKSILKKFLPRRHVEYPLPIDFDGADKAIIAAVRPFTMTSPERLFSLIRAIEYIVKHGIAGDIVECGVWRGGSMMAAVLTLQRLGVTRDIHLFDTYEGMSKPTGIDRSVWGKSAGELMRDNPDKSTARVWAYSTIDEVKKNLSSTGYPARHFHYHKGRVEDTIPGQSPALISLLRLDTDWYESTRHELLHLYPCLAPGGVLIVDDYGHWEGARKAVDEYIDGNNLKILLNRIDYTGRIAIKP